MREKLIELIGEIQDEGRDYVDYDVVYVVNNERVADYLIQNGVTFATDNNVGNKWIPVEERLPIYDDADENGELIAHHKIRGVRVVCVDNITRNPERYTHWMPLPEQPKEEVK